VGRRRRRRRIEEKEEDHDEEEEEQRRLFLLGCSFTISLSGVWPKSSTIQMALQLQTGVVSPSLSLHRGRWLGRLPGCFSHPGAALCALSSIILCFFRSLVANPSSNCARSCFIAAFCSISFSFPRSVVANSSASSTLCSKIDTRTCFDSSERSNF
jgi:hypothetical protein